MRARNITNLATYTRALKLTMPGTLKKLSALKKLMTHPEHYVRWAAVQGICSISREEGIECLRKSLEDDHPHIRNAALKSLANC